MRRTFTALRIPWYAGIAAVALLGGCDLGPDYKRPALEIPVAFRATPATEAAAWPAPGWWQSFGSPQLDALMAQARAQNFDIAAAVARIREADAQTEIAGAPLLPSVSLQGNGSWDRPPSGRSRSSTFTVGGAGGGSVISVGSGGAKDVRQYSLLGTISYELDFWGKNRASLEAAQRNALFSRFDQQTVALTALASVATTYFTALAFEDRLAIAEHNLKDAENALAVIRARFEAGTASLLDVSQQAALVAGERANLPALRSQRDQELIGLGILVGRPPEALSVKPGTLRNLRVPAPAPGLPSELLARRPDVAAAEAQLMAANANIKVARAAFFPAVNLTASGGWESLALSTLFGPGTTTASLAGSIVQTVFDNGNLSGQLENAKGRYDELLADYRKSVVQAFTDVENAVTALRYATRQEQLGQQAVATAQQAVSVAQAQLQAGTVDVTTLLTTEQTLYTDEDSLAQTRLTRFQAAVNLYKALGGGWTLTAAQAHTRT